jgi:sugar phosphate isomerase/epimerase
MMPLQDFSRCCIHTITLKHWSLDKLSSRLNDAGVKGITVWRDALTGKNIREQANLLRSRNIEIVSLCRGGFFPALEIAKRQAAIQENIRAINDAAELGAPMLVLVCGAAPGQSLHTSREQIREGIEACIQTAEKNNVILTIEPLHPMYAGDRSAINTLAQANDMAEYFNSPYVAVAVDVYHVWWDPHLRSQIQRCAQHNNLKAFHICDWMVPTTDLLNDRGIMGEGCIDVPLIREWVEDAGFQGYNEVEIFSNRHWSTDQDDYFSKIQKAYLSCS